MKPRSAPEPAVCIQGRGAVGMALALALAHQGLPVAWVAGAARPPSSRPDPRTYALNAASRRLLQALRVWEALAEQPGVVTPVREMAVHGDRGGQLAFSAWQQRQEALAWIVDAAALDRALATALRYAPHVQAVEQPCAAPLQALCEGRDGETAARWGARRIRSDYGQAALATRLQADRPHRGRAWQSFASPAVLALLPFDGAAGPAAAGYGLVWSLPQARAEALRDAPAEALEAALQDATGGVAGTLRLADPDPAARACWPLRLVRAERWHGPVPEAALHPAGPRAPGVDPASWLLLGDAAHVVHPLAGQGLNLGLADVAALAAVLGEARVRETWRATNDPRLLDRYVRRRAGPTAAMARATDGLWQLFAPSQPVVAGLRNLGLGLLDHLPPAKRWLAAQALGG